MTDSRQTLLDYFDTVLGLPPDAAAWLLDLWDVIQVFDDVADGDTVSREDLHKTIWQCLVKMPSNSFFVANSANLLPVMATAFLKWVASDSAEREGRADARSFMWRASYYDVVLMAMLLCNRSETALVKSGLVMALYGEKFDDYRAEFPDA